MNAVTHIHYATLEIKGRMLNVTFQNDGVIIQSDDGIEVKEKSDANKWLKIGIKESKC